MDGIPYVNFTVKSLKGFCSHAPLKFSSDPRIEMIYNFDMINSFHQLRSTLRNTLNLGIMRISCSV